MENEIEFSVGKGERLCHVRAYDTDSVALPLGDQALALQLPGRIVQHRTLRAKGGKDRHLLPPAGGEAQHLFALQVAQPLVRHLLHERRSHHGHKHHAERHVHPNTHGSLLHHGSLFKSVKGG